MPESRSALNPVVADAAWRGLGRLCDEPAASGLRWGAGAPGFARLAASFTGDAYARHRHETYALALTQRGVQRFWYRGAERHSRPGQVIVLHPDEPHTGGAGTAAGLTYRMLYLDPALLRDNTDDTTPLPFVREPVVSDPALRQTLVLALTEMAVVPDPLRIAAVTASLAEHLRRLAGHPQPRRAGAVDHHRLDRARDYLIAHAPRPVSITDLAASIGLDRFQLARQFRARFGTTPYQFVLARRLAQARLLIEAGMPLAAVAAETGFADQSHLHRQFKRAYGLSPGRWRRLIEASGFVQQQLDDLIV